MGHPVKRKKDHSFGPELSGIARACDFIPSLGSRPPRPQTTEHKGYRAGLSLEWDLGGSDSWVCCGQFPCSLLCCLCWSLLGRLEGRASRDHSASHPTPPHPAPHPPPPECSMVAQVAKATQLHPLSFGPGTGSLPAVHDISGHYAEERPEPARGDRFGAGGNGTGAASGDTSGQREAGPCWEARARCCVPHCVTPAPHTGHGPPGEKA